jgi:alcohol dehydrogenase YqhD (iron-dependent ADH family)
MKYYSSKNSPAKFAQFVERVFGIQDDSPEKTAEKGIEALKAWFDKMGSPTSLSAANIPEGDIEKIAENAANLGVVWKLPEYTKDVITEVLKLCK